MLDVCLSKWIMYFLSKQKDCEKVYNKLLLYEGKKKGLLIVIHLMS